MSGQAGQTKVIGQVLLPLKDIGENHQLIWDQNSFFELNKTTHGADEIDIFPFVYLPLDNIEKRFQLIILGQYLGRRTIS